MEAKRTFQILVIPFVRESGAILYGVLDRRDLRGIRQFVAGGGSASESPEIAALRELKEELSVVPIGDLLSLDSRCTIPAAWFDDVDPSSHSKVLMELPFGAELESRAITLSDEHDSIEWLSYDEAVDAVTWESNRNALWELHGDLTGCDAPLPQPRNPRHS